MSTKALLVLLVLSLALSQHVYLAVAQPSCQVVLGGHTYDFTGLTLNNNASNYQAIDSVSNAYYGLNICGLTTQVLADCYNDGGMACEYAHAPPSGFEAIIARWDNSTNPVWGITEKSSKFGQGVFMNLTNGDHCDQYTRVTVFYFICSNHKLGAIQAESFAPCSNAFIIPTSAACLPASSSSHGLSGGWVFVIIVLVLTCCYCVSGVLYKSFKLGTRGVESIPNIAQWQQLPSLVKDGCIFTWRLLTCKQTRAVTYRHIG